MPMVEKDLSDVLVDLRLQQSLGHDYVPIGDMIGAVQSHLDREQSIRASTQGLWDRIAELEHDLDEANRRVQL